VVTKKRRRSQLAQAQAQRQQARRAERARRRRRRRTLLAVVAAVLAIAALVTFIVLHDRDSGSAAAGRGDYAALVDRSQQTTDQATTTGGTR
jgi:ferric-dicitrate binding protein FerR (iron transport regulator)